MTTEPIPINLADIPALASVVEEVRRTRRPRLIRRNGEDVALLTPVPPKRRRKRGRVLTENDPLFDLIGIGASRGVGDVAANKYRYLARAVWAESHPTDERESSQ
jgi:hypothetical protein